jgi:hypothetical protein
MRHRGQYSAKLKILPLIPIIALAIIGIAYSHWQQALWIAGTVTTGRWHQSIGSERVIKPVGYDENRSIREEILPSNQTLQLTCANISDGWHIWAGLVILNDGTVPTTVKQPTIIFIGADGYEQNFTVYTYFYGPYNDGEFTGVWAGHLNMTDLPFKPYYGPGIPLNPGQTAIIWVEFKFNYTNPDLIINPVQIRITIQYDLAI